MRLGNHSDWTKRRSSRVKAGFTFAEILAAMLFVALVIPAAVKGLRIASDAGTVAERKSNALHLGEAMLNQMIVTDQWQSGARAGKFPQPWEDYEWEVETRSWEGTQLTELTMRISFPVRGRKDWVQFATLMNETTVLQ